MNLLLAKNYLKKCDLYTKWSWFETVDVYHVLQRKICALGTVVHTVGGLRYHVGYGNDNSRKQ